MGFPSWQDATLDNLEHLYYIPIQRGRHATTGIVDFELVCNREDLQFPEFRTRTIHI